MPARFVSTTKAQRHKVGHKKIWNTNCTKRRVAADISKTTNSTNEHFFFCHSRAGGNPLHFPEEWIPAFVGMTYPACRNNKPFLTTGNTGSTGKRKRHEPRRICRRRLAALCLRAFVVEKLSRNKRKSIARLFALSPLRHTTNRDLTLKIYCGNISSRKMFHLLPMLPVAALSMILIYVGCFQAFPAFSHTHKKG